MVKFCEGSPRCIHCRARHREKVTQNCPAPQGMMLAGMPSSPTEPCGTCGQAEIVEPGLARKIVTWAEAMARWKAAGSPVRSQARVDELLAICQACPYLVERGSDRQRCGACGCPVNDRTRIPTVLGVATPDNKLVMASEACPLDPPRWTAGD